MIRVISGKAKGRKLKLVAGESTRPVMDRVKENLFNLLGPQFVPGTRWLDLFAGTGQVGIEALSRGAVEVVFVDVARPAIRTIYDNLKHTQLLTGAEVIHGDAFSYLSRPGLPPFDLIYVAPPQYKKLWLDVLMVIDSRPEHFLTADGQVVIQIDPKEYQPLTLTGLNLQDQRRYGNTMLAFYAPAGDYPPPALVNSISITH